ncbi:MAG: RNA chaperone Hfq [Rickettsiales bacterium]|nr:RNA chaperone Hfq [Rickettsiales bacterium]
MANEKSQNIQDLFLNTLRKKKVPVTVFLSNGVKLQGNITGFDNFSLLLRRGPQVQLVYKHTIATVVPGAAVVLNEEDGVEAAQQQPIAAEA